MLRAYAVNQLDLPASVTPKLWTFLRDHSQVVLSKVSFDPNGVDADMCTSLMCYSLENGCLLSNYETKDCVFSQTQGILLYQYLAGPGSTWSAGWPEEVPAEWMLDRSWWWDVRGYLATPYCCGVSPDTCDDTFVRPRLADSHDWLLRQDGSYEFCASKDPEAGKGVRWMDDLAVASLSGGWVARVFRNGSAEVYDAASGETLGTCTSPRLGFTMWSVVNFFAVAFNDFLFVSSGAYVSCIVVQRPAGASVQTVVVRKSCFEIGNLARLTDYGGRDSTVSEFFAANSLSCAIVGGGSRSNQLQLHAYDHEGLQKTPAAIINPRAYSMFCGVVLTEELLITLEGANDTILGNDVRCELVLRSAIQPLAPLLHVLCLHEPWFYFKLSACSANLSNNMLTFLTSGIHAVQQLAEVPGSNTSNIIDEVVHHDAPATINPREASCVVRAQWESIVAGAIQQQFVKTSKVREHECQTQQTWAEIVSSTQGFVAEGSMPIDYEKIYLMKFTRNPHELEEVLHAGQLLEPIRDAIRKSGNSCRHPSGATLLVYPEHVAAVMQSISGFDLRPFHIIVTESWKPLVYEAVRQIPSRLSVRPRAQQLVTYVSNFDPEDFLVIVRNFIARSAPKSSVTHGATKSAPP